MWNIFSRRSRRSAPAVEATPAPTEPPPKSSAFATNRLIREFNMLRSQPPQHVRLLTENAMDNPKSASSDFICEWLVEMQGVPGTVYDGERFRLLFRFPERYPMDSPEVTFVGSPPMHRHVYSNGHICLSILYDEWSPALCVSSVCISLLSMLSSSERKERPPDDTEYVTLCGRRVSPKSMRWVFHDDSV